MSCKYILIILNKCSIVIKYEHESSWLGVGNDSCLGSNINTGLMRLDLSHFGKVHRISTCSILAPMIKHVKELYKHQDTVIDNYNLLVSLRGRAKMLPSQKVMS